MQKQHIFRHFCNTHVAALTLNTLHMCGSQVSQNQSVTQLSLCAVRHLNQSVFFLVEQNLHSHDISIDTLNKEDRVIWHTGNRKATLPATKPYRKMCIGLTAACQATDPLSQCSNMAFVFEGLHTNPRSEGSSSKHD